MYSTGAMGAPFLFSCFLLPVSPEIELSAAGIIQSAFPACLRLLSFSSCALLQSRYLFDDQVTLNSSFSIPSPKLLQTASFPRVANKTNAEQLLSRFLSIIHQTVANSTNTHPALYHVALVHHVPHRAPPLVIGEYNARMDLRARPGLRPRASSHRAGDRQKTRDPRPRRARRCVFAGE